MDSEAHQSESQSEFGAGLVVPLVKFAQHLNDRHMAYIMDVAQQGIDTDVHDRIAMWAQGASDHLSEIDDRAPESLKNLTNLLFEMRWAPLAHGIDREQFFTTDHIDLVLHLFAEAAMDLDKMLGVNADWGQWA